MSGVRKQRALLQKLFGITKMVLHNKFVWRHTAYFATSSTSGRGQETVIAVAEVIRYYYNGIA